MMEESHAGGQVLEIVNKFYEKNPFPGFDPGKYETRIDLAERSSWYARRLDAEIPFDLRVNRVIRIAAAKGANRITKARVATVLVSIAVYPCMVSISSVLTVSR